MTVRINDLINPVNHFDLSKVSVDNVKGAGFQYVSIQTLLEYCRVKLQQADGRIQSSMSGLDDITKAQEKLTNLKSAKFDTAARDERDSVQSSIDCLKAGLADGSHTASVQHGNTTTSWDLTTAAGRAQAAAYIAEQEAKLPELNERVTAFDAQVEEACKQLEAVGQNDAAKAVREAAAGAKGNKEGEEKFQKVLDAQIGTIGASREMAMVRMQAEVQQRGTMLQMITNLISAINEAPKAIAGNMRGA